MKIFSIQQLGELIRTERKVQGLRQKDLADAIGVGIVFLSDLENGKPTAEVGKVLRVLHGLSLNVDVSRR